MFIAPVLLWAARVAATRVLTRAAIGRVAAGGAPPLWARAGFGAAKATERVSTRSPGPTAGGGRGLTQGFRNIFGDPSVSYAQPIRAMAPRFMAKPSVPLRQRLAAETTLGGKASTLGGATARGLATAVDRSLVPGIASGGEVMGWGAALGALRDDQGNLPRISLPQGPEVPFGGASRAPMPNAFTPGVTPERRGAPPGPYGPGVPSDWRPPVGAGPERPDPNARPPGASGAQNRPVGDPRSGSFVYGQEPVQPPSLVGPPLMDPVGDAGAAARVEFENQMNALNAGYQNMINQIRSMYQLSETEEEKEMLRFQLADLEAQYDAGKEAIGTLYAEKTQTIQALATRSRTETTAARDAAEQNYSQAAIDLMALQEARNAAQVQANRGLGIGGVQGSPYEGLLQTLAPIAGEYAQRIGDIGSEGLDYLGALTESMGAARQGELQSLYAGTRSGAISQHAQNVAQRIAAERLAKASALQSAMQQQLSAQASLMGRQQESIDPTPVDFWNTAEALAQTPGMTPEAFSGEFSRRFGRLPDQHIMDHFMRWNQWFRQQNAPSQEQQMSVGVDALLEALGLS